MKEVVFIYDPVLHKIEKNIDNEYSLTQFEDLELLASYDEDIVPHELGVWCLTSETLMLTISQPRMEGNYGFFQKILIPENMLTQLTVEIYSQRSGVISGHDFGIIKFQYPFSENQIPNEDINVLIKSFNEFFSIA